MILRNSTFRLLVSCIALMLASCIAKDSAKTSSAIPGGTTQGSTSNSGTVAAANGDSYLGDIFASYSVIQTPTGWNFMAPNGHRFNLLKAVSGVSDWTSDLSSLLPKKYGNWGSWAEAQSVRLQGWGFNAIGQSSPRYMFYGPTSSSSNFLPWELQNNTSSDIIRPDMPYHIKAMDSVSVCPGAKGTTAAGTLVDVFDPAAPAAFTTELLNSLKNFSSLNVIAWQIENSEQLAGLLNGHPDLGYQVLSQNPYLPKDSTGSPYGDPVFHAKLALASFMQSKYGSINALDVAWGTQYTTWSTSSGSVSAGTNAYGTGTGFLDENGIHVASNDATQYCQIYNNYANLTKLPQIRTDLDLFGAYYVSTYGQIIRNALKGVVHPPLFVPLGPVPTFVYSAIGPYVDGLNVSPVDANEAEKIYAAAGKPLVVLDQYRANPDSPYSANVDSASYPTQSARATALIAFWQSLLNVVGPDGRHPIIGLEHWGLYDDSLHQFNYGLITVLDNPYDGSASIANGEKANYGDFITPISNFLRGLD